MLWSLVDLMKKCFFSRSSSLYQNSSIQLLIPFLILNHLSLKKKNEFRMAEAMVSSTVGKVVKLLFSKVIQEINYMRECMENIEKFKTEAQKLKDMRDNVQQQIDTAKSKGDNLIIGVEKWVKKADDYISKAEEFVQEEANAKKTCFKIGFCGNWGTLYHYGKRATKDVRSLLDHQDCCKGYESCVSVYTPPPGPLVVHENKIVDDIESQSSCLEEIITAIEDEKIQIIGIYGIGGVGKTTLAMEVSRRVKHLFAAVAFSSVSQTVSVEKIKKDIEAETKRIVKGEKILIILDDVWKKPKLEDWGIPRASKFKKNYKILLTSRSESVCEKLNAHAICVNPLQKDDAWILFKRVVGEHIEADAKLNGVAKQVVERCGGLPLFLEVVGNALKTKSMEEWVKALSRLRDHDSTRIDPEEIGEAFTRLQLSYDNLDNEAQLCFLLCSMFPEAEEIWLEDLVRYVVGLEKFRGLNSMEDARQRVEDAVKRLTSCGLLLKLDEKEYTKMHDVVRDVALEIASEGENNYYVKAGKGLLNWLPRKNDLESYTGISLMKNDISKLPDYDLHLPHLGIFLVQENDELPMFSDELIRGIKEVKVLDMASCNQTLPQSFKLLTKLRVLNLSENESLHDISMLGEMKDLEILILNSTGITEIPQEIGQLVHLRRLEVMGCENLSHVAPGVISKLRWLEELCIGFIYVWEGIFDCLVEVSNLPNLTYLALMVPHFKLIPEAFGSEKLKGFFIQIGTDPKYYLKSNLVSERLLVIDTDYVEISCLKWIKNLIELSPRTILKNIKNLNNILPNLFHEGFSELEDIKLHSCPNVSCLVDTEKWDLLHTFHSSKHLGEGNNREKFLGKVKYLSLRYLHGLEVLWKCPNEYISLSNLVTLKICKCEKLVKLFSVSVAQGLVNLKDLIIESCDNLKEVIWDADEEITDKGEIEHATDIEFRSLAKIDLRNSRSLKSFYSGYSTIKYPSLVDVKISVCGSMKMWGPGMHETPKLKYVGYVPLGGTESINDAVAKYTEILEYFNNPYPQSYPYHPYYPYPYPQSYPYPYPQFYSPAFSIEDETPNCTIS